jgi:methylated-DNA-[protein]-cysteine S-methyltransferase
MVRYCIFETAKGFCGIAWSEQGIARFHLPANSADYVARRMMKPFDDAQTGEPSGEAAEAVEHATRYFAGEKVDFTRFTLDLSRQHDEFRLRIYTAARELGWGQTTTYGALAKSLGRDDWEAAREVGQAMANNPVALIIPCHRVLAAGNKIGGFSAVGGADTKREMLKLEGVGLGAPDQPSLAL